MSMKNIITPFIIKIQTPILGWSGRKDGQVVVLIYNEDKSITTEVRAPKGLKNAMGGEPKQYFYATVENNNVMLGGIAPWQDW